MYTYCVHIYCQFPNCVLSNPTTKINELVYKLLINAPFNILHVNCYKAGTHFKFGGTGRYIVSACGMTGCATCEPVADEYATIYVSAVM